MFFVSIEFLKIISKITWKSLFFHIAQISWLTFSKRNAKCTLVFLELNELACFVFHLSLSLGALLVLFSRIFDATAE